MKKLRNLAINLFILNVTLNGFSWGFYAHKLINEQAVYLLPIPLAQFYKTNIQYIKTNATKPDQRRYLIDNEASKHYFDTENYGDSVFYKLPKFWIDAFKTLNKDSLHSHGTVPWTIQEVCHQLTNAFEKKDIPLILRLSADLGHYVGDINVPLHSTHNYNGQYTNQKGIHGFWESRLPELYASQYDYWIGQAKYEKNISKRAWATLEHSYAAVDSVLNFEKKLNENFKPELKYTYEQRGKIYVKTYSEPYSFQYHKELAGQVERQIRNSIQMTADLWYTCWINAGQPTLDIQIQEIPNSENENNIELKTNPLIRDEAFYNCPINYTSCGAGCCKE